MPRPIHPHKFDRDPDGYHPERICAAPGCYVRYHHVYHGWREAMVQCPVPATEADEIGRGGR